MSWCTEQAGRKVLSLSQGVQRFMLARSLEKHRPCGLCLVQVLLYPGTPVLRHKLPVPEFAGQ